MFKKSNHDTITTMVSCFFLFHAAHAATMRQVHTTGLFGCKTPFECVAIENLAVPTPKQGEALIRVNASSVNPSDVDTVEAGGCGKGCGADISGTVVACPGCTQLKVGDEVWTLAQPAYADYAISPESNTGLKPSSLATASSTSAKDPSDDDSGDCTNCVSLTLDNPRALNMSLRRSTRGKLQA